MRGCGVSWGIMPTLGGLTVWAWQVLTVPGSSERNTLGWGMVGDYILAPFRVYKKLCALAALAYPLCPLPQGGNPTCHT